MDTAWSQKVRQWWQQAADSEGERWARPASPILHDLEDEKAEPHVFFTNTNYRISRKYINIEKVKVSVCMFDAGSVMLHTFVCVCVCTHMRTQMSASRLMMAAYAMCIRAYVWA